MLELPEVLNLSRQLDAELKGRRIASAGRGNRPHKFAFFKPSEEEIAKTLAGRKVAAVRGDGKYIYFDLKPKALFSIAEMDGRILFHEKGAELPEKYQLLVRFGDGAALTATVGLWGFFGVGSVVPVDQSKTVDPLGPAFTLACFERLFAEYPKPSHPIKAFLINRPRLRGFGNGYMQEMLFRAGILPTRRVASLDRDERRRLHRAVRGVLADATRMGGSADACDIYGRPGRYTKAVGARVEACTVCGTPIAKRSFLGGATRYCPRCQK
ncbi:MAG TPA: DNA-formamidopyrimidine glycosylase family protein [Vicinamibacteria bacterium]|nr:DNA-formamidopyrimidine glycosylase family protein [Vicinamibacteria bacterium]